MAQIPVLPKATALSALSAHLGPTHAVNHVMPADARDLLGQPLEPARLALIRRPMVKEPIRSSLSAPRPWARSRVGLIGLAGEGTAARASAASRRAGRASRSTLSRAARLDSPSHGQRAHSVEPAQRLAYARQSCGGLHRAGADRRGRQRAAYARQPHAPRPGRGRAARRPNGAKPKHPHGLDPGAARSGSPWSEAASSPAVYTLAAKPRFSCTCKS